MAPDPISERFGKRRNKDKLNDLAKRARGKDDVEEEKEIVKKADQVEPIRTDSTPGRNDPCPCRSGRKYKKCCGAK